jgi:hypothetical protein
MERFVDYCKDYIAEKLPEYEGQKVYLCDLGFTITEGPNCDGTLTYSTHEAMEYLKEWMYEAADYFDYEKANFGDVHNPFENPEAYMVCMVIEGCRALIDSAISEIPELNDEWENEVELTEEIVAKILEKVKENDRTELF